MDDTVRHLPLLNRRRPSQARSAGSSSHADAVSHGDGDGVALGNAVSLASKQGNALAAVHLRSADSAGGMLRVGDLAKATGKTVRAIHHYENVGLLKPHKRSKGRYRLFAPDAVDRVRWIHKLGEMGMTLAQIQQFLSLCEDADSAPHAMAKLRDLYREKLQQVRSQVARLNALEQELTNSLAYLQTCDSVCDPSELVDTCSECTIHPNDQPKLVAGLYAGQ